jgi:predicted RecA/RadA family phage recombinase
MPISRFLHEGDFVDYTPSADVASGDVVVQNGLVGIALRPILSGTLGALAVEGVFELPKATGASTAIDVGKKVYWNATNKQVTETASGNTLLGKTVKASVDADAIVRVSICQGAPA